EHGCDRMRAVRVDELGDERVELALRQRAVDEVVQRLRIVVLLHRLLERTLDLGVEDHATGSRQQQVAADPTELDRLLELDLPRVESVLDLLLRREAGRTRVELLRGRLREVDAAIREVVHPEHHVFRRRGQRTKDMVLGMYY